MKKFLLATALTALVSSSNLYALESHLVYNPQGVAVFEVRFFDVGDGPFVDDDPTPLASTWNLESKQKEKILTAMAYWAEVITPKKGVSPAIINVGTFDDVNAFGASEFVDNGSISISQLYGGLNGIDVGSLEFGSHAQFGMGKMSFDTVPYAPSQLARTGDVELFNVAVHELGHGLGINSMVRDISIYSGIYLPFFKNDPFNAWTSLLRDDHGNPAKQNQAILCHGCHTLYDPDGFDVRKDQGYLVGAHISEVLNGSMKGIPVKILDTDGSVDNDYMSHSELKNSMMSHQDYRNYMVFMEAELALLQDMGYHIDRRNFFGSSLYNDGQTLYNRNGYFLRHPQGNAYVAGRYNTATLGLGLHVYGSHNRIYQLADLLTKGDGGAGIRVDGQDNTLSIEPGTRIYADGVNGNGIMFAYGKDHHLIHRGDVQALGEGGVGIRFDFGNNSIGNDDQYRGSWIYTVFKTIMPVLPELQGALVDQVDISGRVAGKAAAIYIANNALVGALNIVKGALLDGNIYSEYNQKDGSGNQRLTQLTFGLKADADGRATGVADPDFSLTYHGNISGINNLALQAKGGKLSLNGEVEVVSLTIDKEAKLSGNARYTLNHNGLFINNGMLSPGNSFGVTTITGNYQQGSTGQLLLEMDGHGGHDTFQVTGHAQLDGQLTFVAQPDWYSANWRQNSQDLLQMNTHSGQFSRVTGVFSSPTLSLNIRPQGTNAWQLSVQRAANAYSQYAQHDNAHQVGRALDHIVAIADTDIQPLYRALDFSAVDGTDIRNALPQLSAAAYSGMFASSLNRERQIKRIVEGLNVGRLPQYSGQGEWRSFAVPFGGGVWQQRREGSVGYDNNSYGIVFGVEKASPRDSHLVYGLHASVSGQSLTVNAPERANGESTAFNLGIHARYGTEKAQGMYLFGHASLGIEDSSLDRNLYIGNYTAHHSSHWTGLSGSLAAGGGYRWALTNTMSAGLFTSLHYTTLHRPSVQESGTGFSQLRLGAKTFNALRSSMGVRADWHIPLATGASVAAELQLAWAHELLNGNVQQSASFVPYRSVGFNARNRVAGRHALVLNAAMRYKTNAATEFGIEVGSEWLRSGHHSITGNLSATWRF